MRTLAALLFAAVPFAAAHCAAPVSASNDTSAMGKAIVERESADERLVAVYAPGLAVAVKDDARRQYVVNATPDASLVLELASAREADVYDTVGRCIRSATLSEGLCRVEVPASGYVKLEPFGRRAPVKIVFDTDMITDYDDMGALAMLHALADRGECEILATVSSTRGNSSVAAIEICNAFCGRPDLPVGAPKSASAVSGAPEGHEKYVRLAKEYAKWVRHANADDAPDAAKVYRRVLAAQPDASVVLCSVGFLTNLRDLLASCPDEFSPLSGRDLVKAKVRRWVAMGGFYPWGEEYNFKGDPAASRDVLRDWPTPMVYSDGQYGKDVYTGRRLASLDVVGNPVRDVYRWTLEPYESITPRSWDQHAGHSSWDQTAVLAAVRGVGSYFTPEYGTYEMTDDKGRDEWRYDLKSPSCRLLEKTPRTRVAEIIDGLMESVPRGKPAEVEKRAASEGGAIGFHGVSDDSGRFPLRGGFKAPPVGWMTWYALWFDTTEEKVLRNAKNFMEAFGDVLAEKPVFWIDWEWFHPQLWPNGSIEGEDSLTPRTKIYPRGLAPVAADLKSMGYVPGLWVSVASDVRTNALWSSHSEWLLPPSNEWCGPVWGDPTAPGFCETYVPELFRIYKSWGYEAFKWDTLPHSITVFEKFRGSLKAPFFSSKEIVRKMVEAGRRAVGDAYLLSCSGETDEAVEACPDLFSAARIGADVSHWHEFVKEGVDRFLKYSYLHGDTLWCDMDNLVLREPYSNLAQARTRITLYSLFGVPLTLGDEVAALDRPRIDMLRKVLPTFNVRPKKVGLRVPGEVFRTQVDFVRRDSRWTLHAFTNFETNKTLSASFNCGSAKATDFWTGKELRPHDGVLEFSIDPCDTVCVRTERSARK